MIEVRLFATLRLNRGKVFQLDAAPFSCGEDILKYFSIPEEEIAIFLINGYHSRPSDPVKDGDVIALFPPVGGG